MCYVGWRRENADIFMPGDTEKYMHLPFGLRRAHSLAHSLHIWRVSNLAWFAYTEMPSRTSVGALSPVVSTAGSWFCHLGSIELATNFSPICPVDLSCQAQHSPDLRSPVARL
eukprot:6145333-Pleurochrysis_carterae.AAC.1